MLHLGLQCPPLRKWTNMDSQLPSRRPTTERRVTNLGLNLRQIGDDVGGNQQPMFVCGCW